MKDAEENTPTKHKPAPKQLKPREGQTLTLLGEPRVFKVVPSENGGAYLQFETSHASGIAVPVHAHREEDEAFYVLTGEFEFVSEPKK